MPPNDFHILSLFRSRGSHNHLKRHHLQPHSRPHPLRLARFEESLLDRHFRLLPALFRLHPKVHHGQRLVLGLRARRMDESARKPAPDADRCLSGIPSAFTGRRLLEPLDRTGGGFRRRLRYHGSGRVYSLWKQKINLTVWKRKKKSLWNRVLGFLLIFG